MTPPLDAALRQAAAFMLASLAIAACDDGGGAPGLEVDAVVPDAASAIDATFGRDAVPADRGLVDAAPSDAQPDAALADGARPPPDMDPPRPDVEVPPAQGAHLTDAGVAFRLASTAATRVEVWVYAEPTGEVVWSAPLTPAGDGDWTLGVAFADLPEALRGAPLYYGYRLWGPNWPHTPTWAPGSAAGFRADVDQDGHRFNPNKLVIDPYARELSHDPFTPPTDGRVYASGEWRARDSGPQAPKGILFSDAIDARQRPLPPTRPFKDEIIYEVHLRGLTMHDPAVPADLRGTYAGAALKARALADLGITAIEFLPLHETQNDQNDLEEGADGDNYWGYSTLNFFAPDRRYAADQSAGGPTRELRAMIDAFHAQGIKVYLDVVYNHTGEGGLWGDTETAAVLSWRGVDNAAYYQTRADGRYWSNNGVGPNMRMTAPATRALIIASLRYAHERLGFDGFRFDLASILGNRCAGPCFEFDNGPDSLLAQITRDLPVRSDGGGLGVDLIAEPWAIGAYQAGQFPAGWAEWNDRYRDTIRRAQNRLGQAATTPGDISDRVHGSSDMFRDDGRRPWHSVNFVVAHDGLTLADLYRCNDSNNAHPWPFGPSDGGTDNNTAWDNGDDPARQRQAARTALAVLMLSGGVPMITGGSERLHSLRCNNNAYNLDSPANWLPGQASADAAPFERFARALFALRTAHPVLRPRAFTEGRDRNGDDVPDIAWFKPDGDDADAAYMRDANARYLAWRLDGTEVADSAASIFVAWNWDDAGVGAHLPDPRPGYAWARVLDTAAWMEGLDNIHRPGQEDPIPPGGRYDMHARSLIALIELPTP